VFRRPGQPGKALVDETPVGNFLELEGPPDWIDRTARRLGFRPGDYSLASYRDLYLAWPKRDRANLLPSGKKSLRR